MYYTKKNLKYRALVTAGILTFFCKKAHPLVRGTIIRDTMAVYKAFISGKKKVVLTEPLQEANPYPECVYFLVTVKCRVSLKGDVKPNNPTTVKPVLFFPREW